jgi:uncharacterized membrane protein (UPF0127 family)
MKSIKIYNPNKLGTFPIEATYCDGFILRLKGLMFQKTIHEYKGILLVDKMESRLNSAIHMAFMNFDITVVWIDQNLRVVDVVKAHKWQLFYFPKKSATYVLETHPGRITDFSIGDTLVFEHE